MLLTCFRSDTARRGRCRREKAGRSGSQGFGAKNSPGTQLPYGDDLNVAHDQSVGQRRGGGAALAPREAINTFDRTPLGGPPRSWDEWDRPKGEQDRTPDPAPRDPQYG